MMSHAEIRNWLNERGINGYSGSIGVQDVIITLEAFQKLGKPATDIVMSELRGIREIVESIQSTVRSD